MLDYPSGKHRIEREGKNVHTTTTRPYVSLCTLIRSRRSGDRQKSETGPMTYQTETRLQSAYNDGRTK